MVHIMELSNIFQEQLIPDNALLAGYSYLIQKYSTASYLRISSCVSKNHISGGIIHKNGWCIFDKRYWPGDRDIEHLVFALKHENFDLLSLKRILEALQSSDIENYIISKPTGIYSRKIWFLYEWFTDMRLNIPDCIKCKIIGILDNEECIHSDIS